MTNRHTRGMSLSLSQKFSKTEKRPKKLKMTLNKLLQNEVGFKLFMQHLATEFSTGLCSYTPSFLFFFLQLRDWTDTRHRKYQSNLWFCELFAIFLLLLCLRVVLFVHDQKIYYL